MCWLPVLGESTVSPREGAAEMRPCFRRASDHLIRSIAVVGLLIGVLASFTVAQTVDVAAQGSDVALTIHVLDCPNDAKGDIFEACHGNRIEGADFDVAGEFATSDDEGVVAATVTAGTVAIEELDFDEIATDGRATVYCSPQPGGKPLSEYKTTDGTVEIEIADGVEEVHCDWYNRTDAGGGDSVTVMIHALECPADAEGDIFDACHDNRLEDVVFDVEGIEAISDEDGEATAENVPSGEITIEERDFEELATSGRAYVYCSVQPGGEPVLTEGNTRNGLVTIDVPDTVSEVHCDWYNRTADFGPTPTEDPGEPTETPEPTETHEPTETPEPTETQSGGGSSSPTATVKTTLPTTGAGPTDGSSNLGLAMGLIMAVLAVAAGVVGFRRGTAGSPIS